MKFFFIIISLFVTTCYSSQELNNTISNIIKDEGISSKVKNVLLFTDNSSTIRLNNYENIFITVDASEINYLETDSNSEIKADGMLEIYINNMMSFNKTSLKDLYCYKLKFNKYLVIRVDKGHKNQLKLIGYEPKCDCEPLFSISGQKEQMPQSVFYYYLVRGIPLLSNIGSFDPLEFLQIEFLTL